MAAEALCGWTRRSVEFLSPKELALPGRWIDGGSTYRVLRNDRDRAASSQTTRGGPGDGRRRDHRGRRPGRPDAGRLSCAWPGCGRWCWSGSRGCGRPRRPAASTGRSWNCCATGACWTGSKRPAAVLPPGSRGPVRRCAPGLLAPGGSPDAGGASPAAAARAPARRTRPRTRRRHTPRTRGGRGQPGRRHGDRGRARPGRALPGDRPLPGGLRRRAQPGPRHGRDPVPRHHLSRGQPARPRSPCPIR